MTRDTLEHNQIPVYFVAVILAAAFGLLAPSFAHGLSVLVTPSIAVLMYAMFLQIPFLDLRQSLSNKRFLSALLLANFILVPLLVWALTQSLVGRPALLLGALLVLLTPCIDYVVVFTHIGKGDSRLMLAATPVLLLLQLALFRFELHLFALALQRQSGLFALLLNFFRRLAGFDLLGLGAAGAAAVGVGDLSGDRIRAAYDLRIAREGQERHQQPHGPATDHR